MNSEDKTIEYYYSLKPTVYCILVKLEINQVCIDDMTPELEIMILLRSQDSNNTKHLKLLFEGVRELKLNQPSLSEFNIPFIKIDLIKNLQWEDLAYRVKDEEDESVSFLCKKFIPAIVAM